MYTRRGDIGERARAARADGYAHIDPLLGTDEDPAVQVCKELEAHGGEAVPSYD